jgi:hypothetical protein
VETAALEHNPYRMENPDELAPAGWAFGRAVVVVSMFDFVRFAARLAAIFVNWHSSMVTLPEVSDQPHAVDERGR